MTWRTYERHPISARYPDLKGQAWEDFLENIATNGVLGRSIMLHEGKILDGWQLYRACLDRNIEPHFIHLGEGEDPEEYVERANEHRRHESAETMYKRRDDRQKRVRLARLE